jgi:hypothetical protein
VCRPSTFGLNRSLEENDLARARAEYHASLGLSPVDAEDDGVIYYHDLAPRSPSPGAGTDVAGPVDDAVG